MELEALKPGNTLDPGIRQARDWPELVPVFEEYSAMVASNHNDATWHAAGWESRARAIAFYRLNNLKRLHEEDARIKHSSKRKR